MAATHVLVVVTTLVVVVITFVAIATATSVVHVMLALIAPFVRVEIVALRRRVIVLLV